MGLHVNHPPLRILKLDFNQLGKPPLVSVTRASPPRPSPSPHASAGVTGANALGAALVVNTTLASLSLKGNSIGPDFPRSLMWLVTPRPPKAGQGIGAAEEAENVNLGLEELLLDFNKVRQTDTDTDTKK